METIRVVDQTIFSYWIGLFMVLAVIFFIGVLASASRLPKEIKLLIWLGLGLRVVGSLARFLVLQQFYGRGDAVEYFKRGLSYAQSFRGFDFSPVTQGKEWFGTHFVHSVSGAVLALIGPSLFAEYLVFSMFAFLGLAGFAVAFHRAYPTAPISKYLLWIWAFPSLWFWPSSVGKEALLLMGLGLSVMAFIGKRKRINWPLLAFGAALMFAVRPHVLGVFLVAVILAQWLSFNGLWTPMKLLQGVAILGIGIFAVFYVMKAIGIEEFDLKGVREYVETDKSRETDGRTSVEAVSVGPAGIPMAAINILFRPFPWESTNVMVFVSSLEIVGLWGIVLLRRRNLMRSVRNWRSDRFLRLAICFVLIYTIAFGLMAINLGIIARQRIFLFPFLFLLIEAVPIAPAAKERRPTRLQRAVPLTRVNPVGRLARVSTRFK